MIRLRFSWTKAKRAANAEKRPVVICGFEIVSTDDPGPVGILSMGEQIDEEIGIFRAPTIEEARRRLRGRKGHTHG